MEFTCKQICDLLDGELVGDGNRIVNNLRGIESANEGDLTFLYDNRYERYLETNNASCVITFKSLKPTETLDRTYILLDDPYKGFVAIIKYIDSQRKQKPELIHPTAIIADSCEIGTNVYIGAYCVLGENTQLGSGVVLNSNVAIYDRVKIGDNTSINSNVTIYQDTEIGANCIVHAGAVIGSDGFGYIEDKNTGEFEKVPHIGKVIIEDDVEIGANTTIDRAMFGKTLICRGTKIDNLVQIGHNCVIGENSAFASQSGVSGSVKIGKRNRFGGQTGAAGHITTADDVSIMAQSGIAKSVEKSGIYFGSPIKDFKRAFRIEAAIKNLPEIVKDINDLKKKLNDKS